MANQNANPNPNLGPPFNLIKGNEVGIHQVKHIFSSEMLQIEIHPDHPDRQHDLIRPGRLRWTRRWSHSDRRSAAGFTRLDWTETSIDSPLNTLFIVLADRPG